MTKWLAIIVPVLAAVVAALRALQGLRPSPAPVDAPEIVPESLRVHPLDPP